jgi:hypothetical protein
LKEKPRHLYQGQFDFWLKPYNYSYKAKQKQAHWIDEVMDDESEEVYGKGIAVVCARYNWNNIKL